MLVGDWAHTKPHLASLADALRVAVAAGNELRTLCACTNILAWGGNRNWAIGAYPFLHRMATGMPPGLCDYIRDTGTAFQLPHADTGRIAPPVRMMNSMLTKVHALYATDGLPIYDSRVAAAIASLVECWRVANGLNTNPLPPFLVFPATTRTRTVFRRFPRAAYGPRVLVYGTAGTHAEWSGAKLRLGWLMEEVLKRLPNLFQAEMTISGRMHAFEACLFMIGYDVACLACPTCGGSSPAYKTKVASLLSPSATPSRGKTIKPLSNRGENIIYSGDLKTGFTVTWGKTRFRLDRENIDEILSEFGGRKDVPLGASQTPPRPAGSLGQWLEDNGWPSARYASAIAAILRKVGVINHHRGQKPIRLTFA